MVLRVYSSQPVGLKLACVLQGLVLAGHPVVELPLSALPPPESPPRRRCTQRDDLLRVSLRLAEIGDQLNDHENGICRLDAGMENGLRAERDSLAARQRGLRVSILGVKEGGQADG